jgi:hypothetical protein
LGRTPQSGTEAERQRDRDRGMKEGAFSVI